MENLNTIIDTLSEELYKREQQGPDVVLIKKAIKTAKDAYAEMVKKSKDLDYYNSCVNRIRKLQEATSLTKSFPFNTEDSDNAIIQQKIRETKGQYYQNYYKSRFQKDVDFVKSKNKEIESVGIKGYTAIMNLREQLTGQTIIYGVRGTGSKKVDRYEAYIKEDEFLQLLKSKPQYTSWTSLRTIDKEYKGAYLNVSLEEISRRYERVKSTDIFYTLVSKYASTEKNNKLRVSEIWEMYSEAKTIFRGRTNITEEEFERFMGERLALKKAKFKRYSTHEISEDASFSTLSFYQGGDTSTYSKYVAVQNKSSSIFEAGVNVKTIFNGLRYITEIFKDGYEIDPYEVKKLFTAIGLENVPKNVSAKAFRIANSHAQRQISRAVKLLNGKT